MINMIITANRHHQKFGLNAKIAKKIKNKPQQINILTMEKKDFYGFSKKKTATVYIEFVKKFS